MNIANQQSSFDSSRGAFKELNSNGWMELRVRHTLESIFSSFLSEAFCRRSFQIPSQKSKGGQASQIQMPLKLSDATVSSFDNVFDKFKSEAPKNKANFILFLADKDPSTSLSWCPGTSFLNFSFQFFSLFFLHVQGVSFLPFLK